jgi:predicted lipoprotein
MKKYGRMIPWAATALLVVLIAATCRVTVIPDEVPQTEVNEEGETVVITKLSVTEQYTIDNWDSKVIPSIYERAVDITTFLAAVSADLDATGREHGNRANETSAWSFCVQGEARVLEIENADKPNKTTLLLDVAPYDTIADCRLHYGKVFSSNIKNAIRDGVGFLKLDDFTNQVEFADLTTALNNKVKNEIILQTTAEVYAGKTITFYGCISLQDAKPDSLVIVPVQLQIME